MNNTIQNTPVQRNEIVTANGSPSPRSIPRRSFLRRLGLSAALLGPTAALVGTARASQLTPGDVAILQFLAAAELVEADLWRQYTELALHNPSYGEALEILDDEMGQYISDNTDDENSHANFLNAFLASMGEQTVNLDAFRTLPSSHATGAQQIGRLTNLMNLTVDTSWWIRYRSPDNPDFGATFPQFIEIENFPAIPAMDLPSGSDQIQAIANAAAFHFAAIEQGGTSLYASLIPKAANETVVEILAGIGGSEVNHFAIWHDKAGNAPEVTFGNVKFPDMKKFEGDPLRQKDLIMPEPCRFISTNLPLCSVMRPTSNRHGGPLAAAHALTDSGLFAGQSEAFFRTFNTLARRAAVAGRR
jgi:hypothetical protein